MPVTLAWSAKASIINWMLEGEDVGCPVDDMKTLATSCLRFHVLSFE